MQEVDVAIVGGGGAGLTAAIYAARSRRSTFVFEGLVTGGQISTTDAVENFPGFPDGINGFELAQNMLRQAEKFGAEVVYEAVESITRLADETFELTVGSQRYRAEAIVFAAGAAYNKLKVPGEDDLVGKGVSYCATCDGAFFRDMDTVVVGGGDAALDEGLFLARFARGIRLIHRRDSLRASALLQERARANPKFSFIWDTVVEAITGKESVEGVQLRNLKTGATSELATSAVFIFIGQTPNNHLLKDLVDLDEGGHAVADLAMCTRTPGLFVAGDIRTAAARQLVSACGDGATAAISAEHYLAAREHARPA